MRRMTEGRELFRKNFVFMIRSLRDRGKRADDWKWLRENGWSGISDEKGILSGRRQVFRNNRDFSNAQIQQIFALFSIN